jgi:hypothetical protein
MSMPQGPQDGVGIPSDRLIANLQSMSMKTIEALQLTAAQWASAWEVAETEKQELARRNAELEQQLAIEKSGVTFADQSGESSNGAVEVVPAASRPKNR